MSVMKSTPISSLTIASKETNSHDNAMVDQDKNVEIHLSLKKIQIDVQMMTISVKP